MMTIERRTINQISRCGPFLSHSPTKRRRKRTRDLAWRSGVTQSSSTFVSNVKMLQNVQFEYNNNTISLIYSVMPKKGVLKMPLANVKWQLKIYRTWSDSVCSSLRRRWISLNEQSGIIDEIRVLCSNIAFNFSVFKIVYHFIFRGRTAASVAISISIPLPLLPYLSFDEVKSFQASPSI